jgi:hypothetical protein
MYFVKFDLALLKPAFCQIGYFSILRRICYIFLSSLRKTRCLIEGSKKVRNKGEKGFFIGPNQPEPDPARVNSRPDRALDWVLKAEKVFQVIGSSVIRHLPKGPKPIHVRTTILASFGPSSHWTHDFCNPSIATKSSSLHLKTLFLV